MSSLTSKEPEAFDIVTAHNDIYIDNDLDSKIERIVDEKLNKILSQKNLMNKASETTKAKVQLLFGQDVYIVPKG